MFASEVAHEHLFHIAQARSADSREGSMRRSVGRPLDSKSRKGAASLDYALVLGVILPLATIVIPASISIIRSVYSMIVTLIAWPFM